MNKILRIVIHLLGRYEILWTRCVHSSNDEIRFGNSWKLLWQTQIRHRHDLSNWHIHVWQLCATAGAAVAADDDNTILYFSIQSQCTKHHNKHSSGGDDFLYFLFFISFVCCLRLIEFGGECGVHIALGGGCEWIVQTWRTKWKLRSENGKINARFGVDGAIAAKTIVAIRDTTQG